MPANAVQRLSPAFGSGNGPVAADYDYAAWTGDPGACIAGTAQGSVAGVMMCRRITLPGPTMITNLFFHVSTVINTPTAGQNFALAFDANGTILGVTADQTVPWASTGLQTMALVGGPFLCETPAVYVAYWFNATAGPFLFRGNVFDAANVNGPSSVPVQRAQMVTANTGLTTTPPASIVMSSLTKVGNSRYWAAVN